MKRGKTKKIVAYSSIVIVLVIAMLFGTYKFMVNSIEEMIGNDDEGSVALAQAVNDDGTAVKTNESEQVHAFVATTHERWNSLLCYGKWQYYEFGDLRRNLAIYEGEFDEIFSVVNDDRIKKDIENARTLLKIALKNEDRTALVFVHRIFHDLDIAYNGYNTKGFGGFSSLANGKEAIEVLRYINKHNN